MMTAKDTGLYGAPSQRARKVVETSWRYWQSSENDLIAQVQTISGKYVSPCGADGNEQILSFNAAKVASSYQMTI
jgi:hypothetical protein